MHWCHDETRMLFGLLAGGGMIGAFLLYARMFIKKCWHSCKGCVPHKRVREG